MTSAALLAIIAVAEMNAGIPRDLLKAICTVESNLNPHAITENDGVGGRASIGACQVQRRTAQQFRPGVTRAELLNPIVNVNIAAEYLVFQYLRYNSWDRAVVAFNRGSSTGELNSYHGKVMRIYGRSKADQGHLSSRHQRRKSNAARGSQRIRENYAYAD